MSRKKEVWCAVAGGCYLALGHPGQYGFRDGCLTKKVFTVEEATKYSGKRQHKQLERLVDQMQEARAALSKSVIYDWPALKELRDLGVITTIKIEEPKPMPKRKRLKLEQ